MNQTFPREMPSIAGGAVLPHSETIEKNDLMGFCKPTRNRIHKDCLTDTTVRMDDQRGGELRNFCDHIG
ncbi:hypothetical protein D3C81_2192060 [compost metagenome]